MKFIRFIPFTLFIFLSACAIFKRGKEIVSIQIRYDNTSPILYGYSFEIHVFAIYANGKEREITGKKECEINISGAAFQKGLVTVPNYPKNPVSDTLFAQAEYTVNNEIWSKELKIPFNYLNHLSIQFNGANGAEGSKGKDKGTPFVLRNGNDGEFGDSGETGENGHQIAVYLWKDNNSDLYRMKVTDLITTETFFYTYKDNGFGLNFSINGGRGGNGVDGGTGKDGSISEKKSKEPGYGGNGRNVGNGGSAIIFLHSSAIALETKITLNNTGGIQGDAGIGGELGSPGKILDGQTPGSNGSIGQAGINGKNRLAGYPFQLIIEEFEF